jgi:integrase
MPQVELTDRFCQGAKVKTGRKADHFDTTVRGLCFRVTAGGARAFFLVYTKPGDGKRAWLRIGAYPELGLAAARQKARDARAAIGEGTDPIAEKKAAAAGQAVRDMVENYITRHVAAKRSADEIARRLRKNVSDVIGDVKLSELHRRDITRCVDRVKDRGAGVEANRLFEDIRAMVRWARGRGDLDSNLVEGMRRPTETTERDRALDEDEIRTVWAELAGADMREGTRRILRLCLVTAQRVGEVSGMTRAELDLETATWTIPAERAKNGREHNVPLSSMAIEIIREQLADVDALAERKGRAAPQWLFPGPGARAAVTGGSIPKAVARGEWSVAHFTPHDLRRTAATGMETLGVSPYIIGHVLNHVSATKATITSKVYARYGYMKEKREALDLWAARLAGILTCASVIPLRSVNLQFGLFSHMLTVFLREAWSAGTLRG